MPHLCYNCQVILCAIDQRFTDGGINDSGDKYYNSSLFTGGFRGWITAATEGTCDLCSLTYFNPEPDLYKEALDEISHHGEMTCILTAVLQLKALGGEAGSSTWGPRTVTAIRGWLDECISSHDECRTPSNFALPMRLLDVSPAGTRTAVPTTVDDINSLSIDVLPQVKLFSTADLPSDTKYLTLSHCWGTGVSMKLPNKLLNIYESQIPLVDLSSPEAKVFKEAIWITRCLGYRYLWIDALCINQEDETEKSIEISQMDQIFSGAEANLSATSASSGADGMIFNREHSLYELFPCEWKEPALEKTQDEMLQEKKDYLVVRVPREIIVCEPVNKRAWVFQERILAPRVIHFCRNRIHWECTRETATELQNYSPWIIEEKGIGYSHTKYARYASMEGIDDTKMGKKDWCHRFRGLVDHYSYTSLTFPQDRLASLADIAKKISVDGGLRENEYFAGLWGPDLPEALMWKANHKAGVRKWDPEHVGYIGPSWSWAGCEAETIIGGKDYRDEWESLVTVIHVWTVPNIPGGSRFGALADGALILKGRLVEMHRKRIGDAFVVSIRDGDSNSERKLYFEARTAQSIKEWENHPAGIMKQLSICWDRYTMAFDRAALPAQQVDTSLDLSSWPKIEPEVFYLLPICQYPMPHLSREDNCFPVEGLVLCRDDTTGSFRRVGIFNTCVAWAVGTNKELKLRLLKVPETELTIV
ncbi:uncharacterized protein FIESC28_01741 [Fusarium coffeatum]|uniref:Heterokaryon incompatibility domain-containing protein n=1 Tax=Fusarium coffeatum TaxID=231269 RepID=A0A366S841_9HYPO|nr:uncharacterized protein FIESC28_01741 [Fusarium coffeatum]RBR25503.1 hypothetical protein FIESC28_01741 [Fusarium coffeatum]